MSLEEMIFKAFSSLIDAVIPWHCTHFPGLCWGSCRAGAGGLSLALCEFRGLCCRLELPGLSCAEHRGIAAAKLGR